MSNSLNVIKKSTALVAYLFYLFIIIIIIDVLVLNKIFGYGYERHYKEENIYRFPAPYVAFTAKPNVEDHNELGFRGPSYINAKPDDLKVAFFGGSTGYYGKPPIAKIIEKHLSTQLNKGVFVANYSVVSSNHRQHLHGILEYFTDFTPDIIIFYGGYNETIQSAFYDPRPGYPFNYFYRSETSPLIKLVLENSAIIGSIDKKFGYFSGINKLRTEQLPFSESWNKKIFNKYFGTLEQAKNITNTIQSKHFEKAKFFAFYQPYNVPEKFEETHSGIRQHIPKVSNVFDVSYVYDDLGDDTYADIVHVNQLAKQQMGAKISEIIANEIIKK